MSEVVQVSRLERRKQRTRAAMIEAAQAIFADRGYADASIQEVTAAADVGLGTFYNHFATKAELFDAAVTEALEEHAEMMAQALADEPDPAQVFAASMRLTGRLIDTQPRMGRIIMHSLGAVLTSEKGHAPHALRDIEAAVAAGRFRVEDPRTALACAAGCLVALMHLISQDPDLPVDELTDSVVRNVLLMFGVDDAEARRLISQPLPHVPA